MKPSHLKVKIMDVATDEAREEDIHFPEAGRCTACGTWPPTMEGESMKPMTKGRRVEIARGVRELTADQLARLWPNLMIELLDAEAYWRNAVKQATGWIVIGNHDGVEYVCDFCKAHEPGHAPDCAWVRAQE